MPRRISDDWGTEASSRPSLEIDVNGVGTQRQCQAGPLGAQADQHAVRILHPEFARAPVSCSHAVACLAIGTWKLFRFLQIINLAGCLHPGGAKPATPRPPMVKR